MKVSRFLALPVALGVTAPAWAQSGLLPGDPTDQSTAPPSVLSSEDLTVPVEEPMPPGGWFYETPPHEELRRPSTSPVAKPDGDTPPTLSTPFAIREIMTEPLAMRASDGRIWARTRDMRASFGPDGFVAYPVFGKAAEREWPVRFDVGSVTLGGEPLDASVAGAARLDGHDVTIPRADLTEVHHLGLDAIEQTFVFDALPGVGDLVVRLDVETDLTPLASPEGDLRFAHDSLGGIAYGAAFALDAAGRRISIERAWNGEEIVLTVPAAFLANATLPVTIDPPTAPWTNGFGIDDDTLPDVTYCGSPGRYFICWREHTSSTNADVYVTSVDTVGSQGGAIMIEGTNDFWDTPRLAYTAAGPRVLVVASRTTDGPGTGAGSIKGQMLNPLNETLIGTDFFVSTSGTHKVDPDIGGSNRSNPINTHFCVVWSRIYNGTTHAIERRIIDWTGGAVGQVSTVELQSGVHHRTPALSESHGDETLPQEWWTLAWIRDTNFDGYGEVWARRIAWNGNLTLGSGNFRVGNELHCIRPSVTSRLDEPILGTGDRPSIIAYERRFTVGPPNSNIYARVVIDGHAYPANSFSNWQEDFDSSLIQQRPSIATDGDCFILTYIEEWWGTPGGTDYDVYMLSGHVATTATDAYLGLAERHENLAFTTSLETFNRLAMIQDGDNLSTSDDGMCVWLRDLPGPGGEIRGSLVDCATGDVSDMRSVGRQYCRANGHSESLGGGRYKSWLWIRGTQSVGRVHVAQCVDMPSNTFGFLIGSRTSASVNMPGGSQGRLCVGGSVGRFVSQVAPSDSSGMLENLIDPQFIPQPTSVVSAQPGETWYFQMWHRDTVGGQSTSNFSNGCSLFFHP